MLIRTAEELRNSISKINLGSPIGVDIETTGLDPYFADIRTIQIATKDEVYVIDLFAIKPVIAGELLRPIFTDPKTIKILHNAKFDLKFIKHQLNIDVDPIFDSYIASLVLEAGVSQKKGFHGLEQTVSRYCGIDISKEQQRSDWSGELTAEQVEYAAKDAEVLLPLREEMIKHIVRLQLVQVAKLEFDAVLPVVWLELCGFYLNTDAWMKNAEENIAKAQPHAEAIFKELEPYIKQQSLFNDAPVNLDSTVQVREYFKLAGVPMPTSTKEFMLRPLAEKYPIVNHLLEYRGYWKAGKDFGAKWLECVNPKTGRIHPSFMSIGAETGRMSCSHPNIQQCPADKATRNCFQAEEGNTLVSLDYSQIELRILAELAKDKNAIEAFKSGVDFHAAMASKAFHISIDKVTSEERSFAKRLNFGIPYGIGASRFAMQSGIQQTEAQLIMNNFFQAVPQEKRWLDYQKYAILKNRYTRSMSGRMARYEFDDADPAQRSQAQRNACNFPIQATSADILKRALRLAYERTKEYHNIVKMVNVVHDELNFEIKEDRAGSLATIIHKAMVDAGEEFLKLVPVKVDTKISRYWEK